VTTSALSGTAAEALGFTAAAWSPRRRARVRYLSL